MAQGIHCAVSLLMPCQEMSPGSEAAEDGVSPRLERPLTALGQERLEGGPTGRQLLGADSGPPKLC